MLSVKKSSRPAALLNKVPESWSTSLLIFLVARLLYSIWGAAFWGLGLIQSNLVLLMYHGVPPVLDGWPGATVGVWQRWDAIHYIRIAENGYVSPELSAFFPLYPWLGGVLHRFLGMETTLALLAVSSLAFLLALVVLYEIVADQYSPGLARRAAAAAALFPTAVFLLAPYPLSLALFLGLFSYRSARKDRWLAAALSGLAAGLCHSTILPLAVLLAWEALRRIRCARGRPRLILLLAPASPLLGTAAFLAWRVSKGFPPFQSLLAEEWGRSGQWPWQTLAGLPELLHMEKFAATSWLNLTLLLASLAMLVWGFNRLKLEHMLYFGVSLAGLLSMNVTGEPLSGFSRYLLLAFPVYIALAMLAFSPWRRRILLALGVLAAFYTSGLFFMWVWLA